MTAIDKAVSRRFWERQSADSADPRSVTLDRQSAASVAREVRLYQQWLLRRLDARGVVLQRALDLGCGNGDWTVELARRAGEVVAVDFAEGFVAHCRARLAAAGLDARATVLHADLAGFEPPGAFGLVVSGAVTQYLADDEVAALLGRIRRALAPGGVLYLRTTVAAHRDRLERRTDAFQGIYRSRAWHRRALAAAGLAITDESLATWFVADELAYRTFGAHAVSRALALPLKGVRWLYRFPRRHDVWVCVARAA